MPVKQGREGVHQEMKKFKEGTLHSGSKTGPVVKNRKQAIAIALSEAGLSCKKRSRGGPSDERETEPTPDEIGRKQTKIRTYRSGGRAMGKHSGFLTGGRLDRRARGGRK